MASAGGNSAYRLHRISIREVEARHAMSPILLYRHPTGPSRPRTEPIDPERERQTWQRRLDELRKEIDSLCREAELLVHKRSGPD
jgi:hypothetical protein